MRSFSARLKSERTPFNSETVHKLCPRGGIGIRVWLRFVYFAGSNPAAGTDSWWPLSNGRTSACDAEGVGSIPIGHPNLTKGA